MIKRKLYYTLKEHLKSKQISLLVGPRQAGKTTLMKKLETELRAKGTNTLFLNLDIENQWQYFKSQDNLIRKIQLELGKGGGVVFIDEIQRKENAGLYLKGIYDMKLPYKFIVSGSGSVELKEKIHESLAGRKRVFYLGTVSFAEFVNYRTKNRYSNKLAEFFSLEQELTQQLLTEYINFGGYPDVILAETSREKRQVIAEIFQSYLEKDIQLLLNVARPEEFYNLIRIISEQAGKLVSYSDLSSSLGISFETVKKYLWYLEKTFILTKIRPFYRNITNEIRKSPIFYFSDLGMGNYAGRRFGSATETSQAGFVFQNMVLHIILDTISDTAVSVGYWRTKDKAEVDFVLYSAREVIPIEVKYSDLTDKRIPRSYKSFIEKYKPEKGYIVNRSMRASLQLNKTKINFVPFYQLLEGIGNI